MLALIGIFFILFLYLILKPATYKLEPDKVQFSSLQLAIKNSDFINVENIMKTSLQDESFTHYEISPLITAINYSNLEMVAFLIRLGADINQLNEFQESPIFLAVRKNNIGCVKILIDNKANINSKNSFNQTPLDVAKRFHFDDIANLLESAHALNSKDFLKQ